MYDADAVEAKQDKSRDPRLKLQYVTVDAERRSMDQRASRHVRVVLGKLPARGASGHQSIRASKHQSIKASKHRSIRASEHQNTQHQNALQAPSIIKHQAHLSPARPSPAQHGTAHQPNSPHRSNPRLPLSLLPALFHCSATNKHAKHLGLTPPTRK